MSLFGNADDDGIHSRFRQNRRGDAIATSAVLTTGSSCPVENHGIDQGRRRTDAQWAGSLSQPLGRLEGYMEVIIIVGVLVLFVWICTLRGDRQWERRTHTKPPAPEWARVAFVLFVAALLAICLVPGIMTGIQNAGVR